MKHLTSPNITIGFAVTFIVAIINVVIASQSIGTISENNRRKTHSDSVLSSLDLMLNGLQDIQLGQREYSLTDSPQYLESRRTNLYNIQSQLNLLENLKLKYQQSVSAEMTIDRKIAELSATIDKRQIEPLTDERKSLLSERRQQLIDETRQILTGLNRAERLELDRIQIESQRSLADTKVAVGISGLLNLLLLAIFYGLVNWDLTKRQQAELKLQASAADFEELYHNAPCGYHSLDVNGKFVRINRTELQMLGYEEDEIIGQKHFVDLLTPESVALFNENFPTVKQRGWVRDLEFQMVHKDGRIVPVSATGIIVNDDWGNYLTSRSTLIDISERMRLRQQAKLSAEISQKIRQSLQLAEILQTAVEEVQKLLNVDRVLIFRFEADGSGTVVRERVLEGYPTVMGGNIVDPCLDGSYRARYQQGQIDTVADITQAGFDPCYVNFLQQFAVRASAIVPIQLRDDELWGLLIVHHCQSTRQWQPSELEIMARLTTQIGIALAQAQLLEREQIQRQELARSNAELEQFAHIASHDLQEPLRMVISYLQLIERRYQGRLDADADEFIGYAVDGAVRMQALIQALLSYARVSSRVQPFALVDTNRVLQNALSNLHVAIAESAAEITFDLLPEVWGDATQLTQLFQNLIANAIKFQQDIQPKIHISVRQCSHPSDLQETSPTGTLETKNAWCFAVADNGIGIESQYLDRIFAIFQRLHPRVNYPGTGVGLAICKKIIERHNGKIWVESTPESAATTSVVRGSVFYFIIPEIGSITPQYAHK